MSAAMEVTQPKLSAASRSLKSASSVSGANHASAARASVKNEFPLTPSKALERYGRYLTAFEEQEIQAYQQIWYVGQLARKINASEGKGPNCGYDDDKGRYKCIKHDHIAYRYEILKGLGKGSFGDVVKAYDHKTKQHRAVKIIRNERRFHRQAQVEVKVLELLKRNDRRHNHNLIHINDWFLFRNHLCISFDMLHQDLYTALKKDGFRGFTLPQVKKFAGSLLNCLRLLRRQRVIHCDLKPENILLTTSESDDIKVIDFGSACLDHQKVHTYIQSRFYRAPEVILGLGYSMAIDMWSLGCILVELYTGHPIFPGRDEKEQLMYQIEVLGMPPGPILEAAKRTAIFFDSNGDLRVTTDRKGRTHTPSSKTLQEAVGVNDELFIDFLHGCFEWDPSDRMTPKEATKHPWITGIVESDEPLEPNLEAALGAMTVTAAAPMPSVVKLSTDMQP
ncbi:uncharacterized protein MONBRDRAFT_32541 [Monosiga brevicollis MX1]|uniref:dual-specificity kinase n=1 Tax=Monosiga brevicollis TaxID=81824 RepID=A9V069_MONBE|nr:uncharacterized protein MONBRDRAFT_32541 [Monosiga brevicollis MX1]EDQ89105.1 predicted protein [Monosiga brevicollis MX1]|eukprot:XP_001746210.1 hypothetical protein [Monosiga brevicollis MX1]